MKDIQTRIRVRKQTRPLWEAIAAAKGWTFSEAAHRIAEKFCEVEGITVKPGKRRREQSVA